MLLKKNVIIFLIFFYHINTLCSIANDGTTKAYQQSVAKDLLDDASNSSSLSEQYSQDSDFSNDHTIFTSKPKMLQQLRMYYQYDQRLSDQAIKIKMKSLKKQSLTELNQQYSHTTQFMQRWLVINSYKDILMEDKNYSGQALRNEINIISRHPVGDIIKSYYDLVSTLTKAQMLTLLHQQIQDILGFSSQDADHEIDLLKNKSVTEIRDTCMQYQRNFMENFSESIENKKQRLDRMVIDHDTSTISRITHTIPLFKNITALLPNRIANWKDADIYEKIANKMKDLGFNQFDINEEIARLKNSKLQDLQKEYSSIRDKLAGRLQYFSSKGSNQLSDHIKTIDSVLQMVHQWGTTAAFIASYGASATGYNIDMLQAITALSVLDPNLTFSNAITKREMLDMIYQQYAGFDDIKNLYMTLDYTPKKILSKKEMLEEIQDRMVALDISPQERDQQMVEYQKSSKVELENIRDTLTMILQNEKIRASVSVEEKQVATLTKAQLLTKIKQGLDDLSVPDDEIITEMTKLQDVNVNLLRTAYLDILKAQENPEDKGKIPTFFNSTEKVLLHAPKTVATTVAKYVIPRMQNSMEQEGKSALYSEIKSKGLQDTVDAKPEGLFDRSLNYATRAGQIYSIVSSGSRYTPDIVGR